MDYRKEKELYEDLFYPYQLGWWLGVYDKCYERYIVWDTTRCIQSDIHAISDEAYKNCLMQRNRYKRLLEFIRERILRHHEYYADYIESSFNLDLNYRTGKAKIKDNGSS